VGFGRDAKFKIQMQEELTQRYTEKDTQRGTELNSKR
jgi:hypothetical protein